MNTQTNLDKKTLIEYILEHSPATKPEDLQYLSLESLVLLKVYIEIESHQNNSHS